MLYGAMNFPVKPVLQELESLALLGFDFLELAMDPPAAHCAAIRDQKAELLAALERHKMQLVCHLPTFVSLADLTDGIRQASLAEVLKALETAASLAAEKVVAHPAVISGMGALVPELSRQYAFESLAAIASRAADLKICLCLENMFPRSRFGVEVDDFKDIFNRFPTLKLTLDTGHAHIGSPRGKRVIRYIEAFADRIGHIHVSDNFGKEDNHLPIGAGVIDFPKVMKALKDIGYDDTITLEVFSRDKDYVRISREKLSAMTAAT